MRKSTLVESCVVPSVLRTLVYAYHLSSHLLSYITPLLDHQLVSWLDFELVLIHIRQTCLGVDSTNSVLHLVYIFNLHCRACESKKSLSWQILLLFVMINYPPNFVHISLLFCYIIINKKN